MNKTRVDDMLIEMITPKIKQIEEKFSNNEPLEQEDINTLLLKSQYNHINHLDQKLDEVTADVASLKHSFTLLEQKVEQRFETFERRFETFERRFETFEQRFETFEQRFETFEQRFETFENKIESTIQKALNKNMVMMIAALGVFATIFKLIDAFTMH
jgi:chromosome segregation ATPase